MAYSRDDVKTPLVGEPRPEREALLTPRDFTACLNVNPTLTPPSTIVSSQRPTLPVTDDRASGRPLSRVQLARERLRQSVAWDISLDGVSKVNNVIPPRGRSEARKVGGSSEVVIIGLWVISRVMVKIIKALSMK